ncbi:helix-turn-helix transcriptional regulator [Thalassotalea ganghwensis]
MAKGSALSKLTRVEQLIGLLKSGDGYTTEQLAKEFGVSIRTLNRDLDLLREQGYPIETDRGRGGGVRLYSRWGIGRISLNYREVIDLLLALSVLDKMNSSLLLTNLKSVRNKLFATFPDAIRPVIRQSRERILVSELASNNVLNSFNKDFVSDFSSVLLESFFNKLCVEIAYQDGQGQLTKRCIEIHYLFISWPVWYLVAWDHRRDDARTFRVDRVLDVNLSDRRFTLKPLSSFSEEISRFSTQL